MMNSTLQEAIEAIAEHLKHIREYLGYIAIVIVCAGIYRCSQVESPNVKQLIPHVAKQVKEVGGK